MATGENNKSMPPMGTLASRSMLAMENDPQWPDLLESWRNEYQPDTPSYQQHVQRAAQAELDLREEERRYDKASRAWLQEQEDITKWDDQQHKLERHIARRRDHAERVAIFWSNVVERFRRSRLVDRARQEKSRKPEIKPNPFFAAPWPLSEVPLLQVITVRVVDGITITTCNPLNTQMLGALEKIGRPGPKVIRRLTLPDTLPPEYQWVERSDRPHYRFFEWNLTPEEFAAKAQREQDAGTEHVLESEHITGNETVLYP